MRDTTTVPGDINPYDEHISRVADARVDARERSRRAQKFTPLIEGLDSIDRHALDAQFGDDIAAHLREIRTLVHSARDFLYSVVRV